MPKTAQELLDQAFPNRKEAYRELEGVTDQTQAAEILRKYVDPQTARQLAAQHCGTFRGDCLDLTAR